MNRLLFSIHISTTEFPGVTQQQGLTQTLVAGQCLDDPLRNLGIRGNTHFPFSDLNNLQIAELMSRFLTEKHLD